MTPNWVRRLVLAIVIAIAVGIGLMFIGTIVVTLKAPIAVSVGGFLEAWGWTIGVLAGLWYFFAGGSFG